CADLRSRQGGRARSADGRLRGHLPRPPRPAEGPARRLVPRLPGWWLRASAPRGGGRDMTRSRSPADALAPGALAAAALLAAALAVGAGAVLPASAVAAGSAPGAGAPPAPG